MTWKEFKEAVDKKLAELGWDESRQIAYIDVSFPYTSEPLDIRDLNGMMVVL